MSFQPEVEIKKSTVEINNSKNKFTCIMCRKKEDWVIFQFYEKSMPYFPDLTTVMNVIQVSITMTDIDVKFGVTCVDGRVARIRDPMSFAPLVMERVDHRNVWIITFP